MFSYILYNECSKKRSKIRLPFVSHCAYTDIDYEIWIYFDNPKRNKSLVDLR